ncbi:TPA: EpsG family protein, partial [Streptococcus suis]
MGYYLNTFCISILFTFLSERGFRKNKNIKGWICGLIGIISLSYLAGIRGASVGTDVSIYVIPYLERFKYFPTLFGFLSNSTIEPGFALLLFLNAKFFATPFFVLFVSQLLVVFPLYLIFYKFRETNSMTLSMILYDFLFYNMSLCIMRQFIATAFFLTGVIIFSDKKLFKFPLIFLSL